MAPNPETNSDHVVIIRTLEVLSDNSFDRKISTITKSVALDEPITDLQQPKKSCLPTLGNLWHITVFAIAEVLAGFTFSLLAPFYSNEATSKGLSVTQTGMVYGSVFVATVVFSPLFGKYIGVIGSRRMFLYGTFLTGATNVLFGFLEWVEDPTSFLALSLSIRIVSAIGESAFFTSVFPLATKDAPEEKRSTIMSILETMGGLGMMVGPFLGGLLYEVDGFYFPFVVCGGSLVVCAIVTSFLIPEVENDVNDSANDQKSTPTKFITLLKMPSITISCFLLIISEMSVTWYLPTLQPFLEKNFQNISTVTTGAMFMVEGATYAVFSPLWGILLDRGLSPPISLLIGCLGVTFGYTLLGPAPFMSFLPKNIFIVATGLVIQGSCVAATFITTLVFMMDESIANGAADTVQTRGMITSLWFLSENIAGYLGSTVGGFTYDRMGFENSTLIVIGLQLVALIPLIVLWHCYKKSKQSKSSKNPGTDNSTTNLEDEKKIITIDRNKNYQTIIA